MKLAGTSEVAKPLSASRIDLCLRFASTPALEARDAKTYALIQTTGAMRASDGLFNIRLTNTFGNMNRLAVVCDGSAPATPPAATATSTEIDPDIAKLIATAREPGRGREGRAPRRLRHEANHAPALANLTLATAALRAVARAAGDSSR